MCDEIFERQGRRARVLLLKEHHFCQRSCYFKSLKSGGPSYKKMRKTCLERYGVLFASQAQEVKDKTQRTFLDRYGVESNLDLPGVRDKGIENAQSEQARKSRRKTNIERYGAEIVSKNPDVLARGEESRRKTMMRKYGVEHPSQVPGASDKAKKSRKETLQRRYGVDWPLQIPEVKEKYRQTMKENGTSPISKLEYKFGKWLLSSLPGLVLETQVRVKNWSIDFLLDDYLYLQFDGAYWHGLDRPLDIIKESDYPRDEAICKAYFKDRFQDEWFQQEHLPFLRVTDREFADDPSAVLERIRAELERIDD